MIALNDLFLDGYAEFNQILGGKNYQIRMYLSDNLKNFYTTVIRRDDLGTGIVTFLEGLVLVNEFEVYQVLVNDDAFSDSQFVRIYNLQVEIAVLGYRNPMRLVPELGIKRFEEFNLI